MNYIDLLISLAMGHLKMITAEELPDGWFSHIRMLIQ